MASTTDYYQLLGVSRTASTEEIKKAYKKMAMKYHPDRNQGDKQAEEMFKKINEANEVLTDPEKRQIYDQYGEEGIKGFSQNGGFRPGEGFGAAFDFDLEDLFGGMFGGRSSRSKRRNMPQQGQDLLTSVTISFEESYNGVSKDITFDRSSSCQFCIGSGAEPGSSLKQCPTCKGSGQVRTGNGFFSISQPCPTCHGEGKIIEKPCSHCHGTGFLKERKTLEIKIPAGAFNGMKMRVSQEGNSGINNGPRGDVYVAVTVKNHRLFEREENDIFIEVPISYPQAVLGDTIEIPTMEGIVNMKIAAGTQPGTKMRLKEKGFPSLQRNVPRGSQYVALKLEVPKNISEKHKSIILKLKEFEADNKERPTLKSYLDKFKKWLDDLSNK